MPPTLALEAESVETGELLLKEQAPIAPSFAFSGLVKRSEWYSSVSPAVVERALVEVSLPGGMKQIALRRRTQLQLPLRFGDNVAELPDPSKKAWEEEEPEEAPAPALATSQSLRYVRRPAQLIAVRRLRGMPSNENILGQSEELAAALRRDGRSMVESAGKPVLLQLAYDMKHGFNSRKQLAMAVWLSVPDPLKENEVAILLEQDDVDAVPYQYL